MRKLFNYFLTFGICLMMVFAFYFNFQWAQNIVLFVAWFVGIMIISTFSVEDARKEAEKINRTIPKPLSVLIDCAIVCTFAAFSWFFTATIWAVAAIMGHEMLDKNKEE